MSSANRSLPCMHTADRAAHDALQTRDHPDLRRVPLRSLRWSRISGAPLRARASRHRHHLCMRSRCAASGTRGVISMHPSVLNSAGLRWLVNPRVARAQPYRDGVRENILSLAAFDQAKREITSWPGYNPTPLRRLSRLAARAGLREILYKDEAERFGILSFKALGGAYAVFKVLQRHILATKQVTVSARELAS